MQTTGQTTAMALDMTSLEMRTETLSPSRERQARNAYAMYRSRAHTHAEAIRMAARLAHVRPDTVETIV
jgi:hypothetical protein